ncbi:MAG TPA: NUDIX hydrolase [Candidatus Saccharimonadales bacterium]|jgi:ADP-ribose pyrophosphatase YjhB (NUDIX family)
MDTPDSTYTPVLTVPSPFYRVTAKALIFDPDNRLLVIRNHNGNWELPGGGWEHNEDFETALSREIDEELGVGISSVGPILFTYRGVNVKRGFMTLRLVAPVELADLTFKLGDDIEGAELVTYEAFLEMDFMAAEGDISRYADKIWPGRP